MMDVLFEPATNLNLRNRVMRCQRSCGLTSFVRPGEGTLPSGVKVLPPENF